MIEAKNFTRNDIRRAYNVRSLFYRFSVKKAQHIHTLFAINKAQIKTGEIVLECAIGSGDTFLELSKKVGNGTVIYGVDLSKSMLLLTENKLKNNNITNFDLKEADCSKLPFKDNKFDVVYSAYMLDIIPKHEMGIFLAEFKRVLKPSGRLVLLNTSKKRGSPSLLEKLYLYLPSQFVLYFLGACRPVLMKEDVIKAQFKNVKRYYLGGKYPSELIIAKKI